MYYQFDYSKLRGKVVEVLGDLKTLAERLGMSYITMMHRTHSRFPFSQFEIIDMCDILGIPYEQIPEYFFTLKVSQNETERSN